MGFCKYMSDWRKTRANDAEWGRTSGYPGHGAKLLNALFASFSTSKTSFQEYQAPNTRGTVWRSKSGNAKVNWSYACLWSLMQPYVLRVCWCHCETTLDCLWFRWLRTVPEDWSNVSHQSLERVRRGPWHCSPPLIPRIVMAHLILESIFRHINWKFIRSSQHGCTKMSSCFTSLINFHK